MKMRWMIWCGMILAFLLPGSKSVFAATHITYEPKPYVEYAFTDEVNTGTYRYISQNPNSTYFQKNYWGSWQNQATRECLTSSMSMGLSYIGVNVTPKEILDYGKGSTLFAHAWADGLTWTVNRTFAEAVKLYLNGNGKYSPPIIQLQGGYSSGSHWVCVIGKISEKEYLILDPYNDSTWTMTMNGATATYTKSGKQASTVICIARQYYNPSASIKPFQVISAKNGKKPLGTKPFSLNAKVTKGDGTVSYSSSNPGVATIDSAGKVTIKQIGQTTFTITAAKTDSYAATSKKVTLKVIPKQTKISKLSNCGSKMMRVKWEKRKIADQYQVQYSKRNTFTKKKSQKVAASQKSLLFYHLTPKTTYYVRVRVLKTVNNVVYYGEWSDTKKIKIKK